MAIFVALVTALIDLLGPPIGIFSATRWEARKVPAVEVAPQPLRDYSISPGPATTLSYFGYEFEVPWNAKFKEKALSKDGHLVHLEFESGQSLTFIVPANQGGLLTEIVQGPSLNASNLQQVFGDLMNGSAYEQYAALLNTTPKRVRAFGPRAQAVRGATLLTIKALAFGPGLSTGAFSFELTGKRGFQIGDPQKSKRVDLEVFCAEGRHVEMLLAAPKSGASLSQQDINRILTSLHSLPRDSVPGPSNH